VIDIVAHADGSVLTVRAQPGARSTGVRGEQDGALKVSVTQAPEKGKANKAVAAVLAKELGLRRSQLELITGKTSSKKKFLVRGLSTQDLQKRLAARMDG